jgi:O-antigen ligase
VVEREQLALLDWFTLAASFLVFVAYLPNIYDFYRVPRIALLAILLGPGLVVLVAQAVKKDLAAIAGCAFLVWMTISTLLADEPRNALWGVFSDASLYALAAYLAIWALGRELSPRGRRYLPPVLIVGASITALAGFAEAVGDIHKLVPTGFPDRASGLTGNPVILGGVMVGAVALLIGWIGRWDSVKKRRRDELPYGWLVLLGFFVAVLNLSGSRIALIAGLLIAVIMIVRFRMALMIATFAAVGLGLFLSLAAPAASGGSAGTSRATEGGGFTPRIEAWKAGIKGVEEKPITGWGPGRYQAAASPHLSERFPQTEGINKVFTAAHNVLIEMLIGGGVVGFVLFAAFIVLAGMNARGAMAWAALGIFATLLLQPMSVMTVPVAMVCLGAADAASLRVRVKPKTPMLIGMGVLALAGVVFGFLLVLSDYRLGQAIKTLDVDKVEQAQKLRFTTSEFLGVKTDVAIKRANQTGLDADKQRAKAIAHETATFDSYYPGWWNFVGATEADWGDINVAKSAFDTTLKRFPWSEAGLTGQLIVAQRMNDQTAFAEADRKLCLINSPNCSSTRAAQQAQQQPTTPASP